MATPNRKELLKFVSRLTDLMGDYDVQHLEAFHDMSQHRFPWVVPVLDAIIQHEKEAERAMAGGKPKKRRTEEKPKKERIGPKRRASVEEILIDKSLFGTNVELGIFAENYLNMEINWHNWKKSPRARLCSKIIRELEGIQANKRKRIETALQNMYASSKGGVRMDFFTQWEQVIKGKETR